MTLFKYIEDADLWRWQLPDSKQFHAGLGEMRLEYDVTKNPAIFDQLCRLKAADIINKVTVATYQKDSIMATNNQPLPNTMSDYCCKLGAWVRLVLTCDCWGGHAGGRSA